MSSLNNDKNKGSKFCKYSRRHLSWDKDVDNTCDQTGKCAVCLLFEKLHLEGSIHSLQSVISPVVQSQAYSVQSHPMLEVDGNK